MSERIEAAVLALRYLRDEQIVARNRNDGGLDLYQAADDQLHATDRAIARLEREARECEHGVPLDSPGSCRSCAATPAPQGEPADAGVEAWLTRDECGTCDLHFTKPAGANEAGIWPFASDQTGLQWVAQEFLGNKRGKDGIVRVRIVAEPKR